MKVVLANTLTRIKGAITSHLGHLEQVRCLCLFCQYTHWYLKCVHTQFSVKFSMGDNALETADKYNRYASALSHRTSRTRVERPVWPFLGTFKKARVNLVQRHVFVVENNLI